MYALVLQQRRLLLEVLPAGQALEQPQVRLGEFAVDRLLVYQIWHVRKV